MTDRNPNQEESDSVAAAQNNPQKQAAHPWYDHAIFYQVYPLSFKDSDGNGRGDLRGLISKIDYLAWLGITAIWLSPVNVSSMKDFGYDVVDYCAIDPQFGTLADFDELIEKLHEKDIRIIIDFVVNHTSSDHPWFLESKSSRDNPKRDWYIWHDPAPGGGPPNNWRNVSLGSAAWTLDETTGQYYFHQFLRHQPDLNWRNPEVAAEMKKVLEFWLKRGVDGFRVDALEHVFEAEHFKDEPASHYQNTNPTVNAGYAGLDHIYTRNLPETKNLVQFLSDIAAEHADAFMTAEMYGPPEKLAAFYEMSPRKNVAPFNYCLREVPWGPKTTKEVVDDFEKRVSSEKVKLYSIANHDVPRIATTVGPAHARIAAMLLLTLPGSPFLYYGDELGLKNVSIQAGETQDTFDFGTFSRDEVRTPMPWDKSMGVGFTVGTPWLPFNADFETVNVESEKQDSCSMLSLYRALIELRKQTPALAYGSYRSLKTASKDLFAFVREYEDEAYVIVLNFSSETIIEDLEGSKYEVLCSTLMDRESDYKITGNVTVRPHEGLLLKLIK